MPEIIRNIENARVPKELVLGNSKYENWKIFKKRWNNYALLTKLSDKANTIAYNYNFLKTLSKAM